MELRHLRYFLAVAEELNFRRAAEKLHLSTPTLSQQIKDLEETLGARLFDRDTTRVRLTAPGEVLRKEARLVVEQAHRAAAMTKEAAQGRRGTLRIGNAGPLSHGFMPACLRTYARQYPEVDVALVELGLDEQPKAVATGEIQVGFTLQPDAATTHRLGCHLVVSAPLRVLLSTAHPLARQKQIALADLAGHRLLAIGGSKVSSHAELLMRVLATRGVKTVAPRPVNGYEAFLALIASGQGVSLLQKMPSHDSLEGLTTRPIKDSGPDLILEAYAIWSGPAGSSLTDNFMEVLRQVCPKPAARR